MKFRTLILKALLPVVILLIANLGFADWRDRIDSFFNKKESGVGLAWLKLGVGARALALGNAYISVASDPTALFWNPAGLSRGEGLHVNFMHNQQFMGIRHEFVGLATKNNRNAYGAAVTGVSTGGIELRNEQQDSLGEYGTRYFMVTTSYARTISKDFAMGISLKGIFERIYIYTLATWLVDFGLSYNPRPNLWFAAVFVNLGPKPEFETEDIKPPSAWKVGASYEFTKFLFSLDIEKYLDAVLRGSVGVEYLFTPYLFLRGGYKVRYETEFVSLGFGIKWKGLAMDYAWRPYTQNLGAAHIFTVTK